MANSAPHAEHRISLPNTLHPHSGQSKAPLGETSTAPHGHRFRADTGLPQAGQISPLGLEGS
jgi:hypothetical protein